MLAKKECEIVNVNVDPNNEIVNVNVDPNNVIVNKTL
jgi:hypothetical protein